MGLGSNFTKSIVREIGRNVGKGISNDLFGDWHATPIRMANKQVQKQGYDLSFVKPEEYDVSVQPEDRFESLASCYFLYGGLGTILIIFIPIIWGQIIWLFLRKKTQMYAKVPMRRKDGRTKLAYRDAGFSYIKIKGKRLLNDDELKRMKLCALFVALGHLTVIGFAFYVSTLGT